MKTILLCLNLFLLTSLCIAQEEVPALTTEAKEAVVDSVCQLLLANYIFPDKASEMAAFVTKRMQENHYATTDPMEFAELLTEDLRSVSHDRHVVVDFDPQLVSEMMRSESSEDSAAIAQLWAERSRQNNYGFKEVKMLSRGVGYLKLNGFSGAPKAGETAAAAMNFLAGSKALIIDLRENGGGSPDMIQILSTYLFDGDLVHLNSFYYRPSDETTQRWTLPYVPGDRLAKADVYILTSGNTFSAAEEFTYNLKNLKRAKIIGETTGGGAHPGGMMPASEYFAVFVPSGRAINPITNTNWEGVGVAPDIDVPANEALDKAHYLAVSKLSKDYKGTDNPYAWTAARLDAMAHPCKTEDLDFGELIGNYGPRTIEESSGVLTYQRDKGPKYNLTCMANDLFMIEEIPYFRLKFIREKGQVIAVEGIYENGHRDLNRKTTSP